jgi:hypothetical protein
MVPGSVQRKAISQFRFPPVMKCISVALRKADLLLSVPVYLGRASLHDPQ